MCLPPGVSCYRTGVKLSQESCSVPCQGIYADVVNGGGEDLHTKAEFKPVFDKYNEYKSGFFKDQGKQFSLLAQLVPLQLVANNWQQTSDNFFYNCRDQPQIHLQLCLRLVLFLNSSSHPPPPTHLTEKVFQQPQLQFHLWSFI